MKGQVLTIDLILGLLIITVTLLSVVLFLPVNEAPFVDDANRMLVLMSEGVPPDWNNTTVIIPGFLTDNRFNATKIEYFNNFTYDEQRALLNIRSDFNITFSQNNTTLAMCLSCGQQPLSYDELLPLRRYALMGSNITLMEVHLYQ
jgi:hypothetical protein